MGTFYTAIQVCICLIFILSAVMKLRDMPSFAELVTEYKVIPRQTVLSYAWITPIGEIAGGVLILFPATVSIGSLLLIALLASFGYAVAKVIRSKRDISCGCYGKWLESRADAFTLTKIIVLMVFCIGLLGFAPDWKTDIQAGSILLGVGFTVIFFVMQMLWNFYQENTRKFD